MSENTKSTHPFDNLDDYISLPRAGALALSPAGDRLVATISTLNAEQNEYKSALWEIDPEGEKAAYRLTQGLSGEGAPQFATCGELLFIAKRAGEGVSEADAKPAVWVLPADGGEAYEFLSRPGGISSVVASGHTDALLVTAQTMPGATDTESEEKIRTERKDKKVAAILHSQYPVRFWDHDLGPDMPRLFFGLARAHQGNVSTDLRVKPEPTELRDLTPDAGRALAEGEADLAADGTFVIATWSVPMAAGASRSTLVRIDTGTGARSVIAGSDDAEFFSPHIRRDSTMVAFLRESLSSPHEAPRVSLWVSAADGSNAHELAAEWDHTPSEVAWLPGEGGLIVVADDGGRAPIFHVTLDGQVSQLTTDDAAYSNIQVGPAGDRIYALRSSYNYPAEIVRVDTDDPAGAIVKVLKSPLVRPELPGHLEEVTTTAEDGTAIRGWLAVPEGASEEKPAPLVLWIHGGPVSSWNAWSWRWCPWLLVSQGYAVLLPDPGLSTGYGQDFIQRGWGQWGKTPFTDLMAITDETESLPYIDATRTAAMGGSFGGYMANWVAGHTDRFDAIVTHASLWALDGFGATTDAGYYWQREMTEEMTHENSPHLSVENINTPMLVVHGDRDYRVPIGEGLRLWYELLSKSKLAADSEGKTPHRFLYFPDENHWVLSPQHAKIWYQVVRAFLAEHVLGEAGGELPSTLG